MAFRVCGRETKIRENKILDASRRQGLQFSGGDTGWGWIEPCSKVLVTTGCDFERASFGTNMQAQAACSVGGNSDQLGLAARGGEQRQAPPAPQRGTSREGGGCNKTPRAPPKANGPSCPCFRLLTHPLGDLQGCPPKYSKRPHAVHAVQLPTAPPCIYSTRLGGRACEHAPRVLLQGLYPRIGLSIFQARSSLSSSTPPPLRPPTIPDVPASAAAKHTAPWCCSRVSVKQCSGLYYMSPWARPAGDLWARP
jgi:hypothetical protein